ncbi:hypothetical protein [Salana multivorans]
MAQAVAASLGQIPVHTLAFGAEIDGPRVHLTFQLHALDSGDEEDMESIVGDFEALVGSGVDVTSSYEVRPVRRLIRPHDGVAWVYLSHD